MTLKTENIKTYRVFIAMHHRCESEKSPAYSRYGGRGITVAPEWGDFAAFLADMGPQPEGMVLDRIDNDGPYSASNCRWATTKQSMRNTSRNRFVTVGDKTMCAAEWSELTGVPRMTIIHRLNRGWDAEAAVVLPVRAKPELLAMFKQMAPALKRAGVL